MPVWVRPCRFEELRTLLREGRVEWGGKPVNDAIEFAEAVASLGTDRGIESFQRHSMIKRRGDSYLALPLGRVAVHERRDSDLLEEVDGLLYRIDAFARRFKSSVPEQFQARRRQIDAAIYDFAIRGGTARLQNILAAIGGMERYFAARDLGLDPKLDRPLSGLSARWLKAADDGAVEFRIGAALAMITGAGDVGPLRSNLAPVDPKRPWNWVEGAGQTAWRGNSLADRMLTLLRRRLMDSERLQCNSLALWSPISVEPEDTAVFIRGEGIDESRMEDLMFACTQIDSGAIDRDTADSFSWAHRGPRESVIPRSYALLKHLYHPRADWSVRPEPAILSLLSAGRTREACDIAQRRLRIAGFSPVRAAFPDEPNGVRLAASLLIPIHSMKYVSDLVLHEQEDVAEQAAGR